MEIQLFFGSGVSVPTGLGTVTEITEKVLLGEYHRHTDSNFYPGLHPSPWLQELDITPHIQAFLRVLYDYHKQFFVDQGYPASEPNYEHLYHLCEQISMTQLGYEENAAVWEFIKKIKAETEEIVERADYHTKRNLIHFAERAMELIENVVIDSVASYRKVVHGFDLLLEIVASELVDRVNVVTLNHDILVESVLSDSGYEYTDGFGNSAGEVRWYDPGLLLNPKHPVTLIKPHGSISWHYFRKADGTRNFGIPITNDVEHCRDEHGQRIHLLGGRPIFLSGGNKEVTYTSGIYADMHDAFLRSLDATQTVIMSGYGWNDKGMSYRLLRWLDRNPERKIILLHENPDEIQFGSRGIMPDSFDGLVRRGQMILLKRWFCNAGLNELQEYLLR